MTDWTGRELSLDFSFLPEGTFHMDAFEDGLNADRWGSDYRQSSGWWAGPRRSGRRSLPAAAGRRT